MPETQAPLPWKQRLRRELLEFWMVATYLAAFFAVFSWYRDLVLGGRELTWFHGGFILIKALVLAKIVLIGNALHIGKRFADKPLIVPTVYKTLAFSLLVILFTFLEETIGGLIHGRGLEAGIREILGKGKNELLARSLVMFCSFLPFFAVQELQSVMGEGKLAELFLGRRGGGS